MDFDKEIKKIDQMLGAQIPKKMRENLKKRKELLINQKDVLK